MATNNSKKTSNSWRVVDILVAVVLGVACGLLFFIWNSAGYAWYEAMNALTPGFGGIAVGIWLLGGVLGGLVIRRPGAALFVEVIAAIVSALMGNQWGIETLYSGIAQGLGAELIFAIFAYRHFGLINSISAGVGAAWGAFVIELIAFGNLAKGVVFNLIYLGAVSISGAILAGVLGYVLMRALAATGALDRFAAGRENRTLV